MEPLTFKPVIKRAPWGGTHLRNSLGKDTGAGDDYAESWEISDHGEDQSIVVGGVYDGWTLSRLVNERGIELLGQFSGVHRFPLLIKYLDAQKTLSVQVHPNDELAHRYDPEESGKAEAWVIMSAEPGAQLYAGLNDDVDETRLRAAIDAGTVTECLNSIEVKPGDCIFNPAGAVHAVGAGIVLAEIQQASDITYRLFDWNRVGLDGKPRPLHVDKAMECIDFDLGPLSPVRPKSMAANHRCEELVRCEYFVMQRHVSDQAFTLSHDRFVIAMLLDGSAEVDAGGQTMSIGMGQTLLLPAGSSDAQFTPAGECTVLTSFLP